MGSDNQVKFGKEMLAAHFPHIAATGVPMLNAGSFGIAPKSVVDRKIQLIRDFEGFSDLFVRRGLLPRFTAGIRAIAELLGGLNPEQCTLIDNVTTGVSSLLEQFSEPGDAILINSWTYGAVKFAAEAFKGRRVVELPVRLPVESPDEIVEQVRLTLDQHPEIKVAIFDHITSATACVMPVQQLTELCHSRGVLVIIDGAHAIGQIPNLDIPSIGADFYVGNIYKWLFAPKAAALMWSRETLAGVLRPSVVSWLVHESEMPLRFAYLGTRDASSLCVIDEAVAFVRDVCGGLDRIYSYCNELADEASQYLIAYWGTSGLPIPREMQAPFMRLIEMPKHLQHPEILDMIREVKLISPMRDFVLDKLKMDALFFNIDGKLYTRVSFSIIVSMEDICRFAEAVTKLTKEDFTG